MAVGNKWIQATLFFIFGVNLLLLAWGYFCSQNYIGITFDVYQLKENRVISVGKQQNDSETHMQNLPTIDISYDGEKAFDSYISCTPNCTKKILYWPGPKMRLPDGEYFCPDINCTVTFNSGNSYGALSSGDVVILHHRGSWNVEKLARYRPKSQMWVYMSWESPPHSRHRRVPNVFNWTMTYHSKSDFPSPYSTYKEYDSDTKERNLMINKNINWAESKTRLAAWIASNCKLPSWPRTRFVKDLSKKMNIDMFGKCGDKSCEEYKCFKNLRSYKFYLAFENSCCTDYITEKMWRNAFMYDVVPIVYGTNKRSYEKLAPPNSFIHVSDFPNTTSLANYIKLLHKNDSLYNKFFRWKNFGYVDPGGEDKVITKERLCLMTRKLCSVPQKPVIVDMNKMWFDTCHEDPPRPIPV